MLPSLLFERRFQVTDLSVGFYINLPLGTITGLLQFLTRTPVKREAGDSNPSLRQALKRLDLVGFGTFAPAVVMCLIAMEWGGTIYSWTSPIILGLFYGSSVAFALFLVRQHLKGDAAMIPLGIISQRVVYCGFLTVFFQLGGLYVLAYYTPLWLQVVKGETPLLPGVFILPTVISQIIAAVISGILGIGVFV